MTATPDRGRLAQAIEAAELDARMLGLLAALGAIWVALDVATGGVFLTPRNLYNLAVQTSVVAVLASGMVLVIAARHIDLAVGSVLGFTGMAIALLQAERLPVDAAWSWPVSVAAGLALGAAIGAWQGFWVAYRGIPAFVVTLAGLLVFRGAAYLLTDGRTVAPLASGYGVLGGAIGAPASLALGATAIAALAVGAARSRGRRRLHGFAPRSLGIDLGRVALAAALILAFVLVMNAHTQPRSDVPRGIPVPVLILLSVALALHVVTRATRFGRYVFAIGGSPEATALAGVNVPRVTLFIFVVSGLLAAVAGVLTTARLDAGTSSMGNLAELSAIAAAVIGGTSRAGGAGSVAGALLGALLMQSLENGMVLLGISSPLRQVFIGLVLIAAVQVDTGWRRRGAQ